MHDVIGINLNMTSSYLNEMHDVIYTTQKVN